MTAATLANSLSPLAIARTLRANRHLLRLFTLRDALGRYQGSLLGLCWSFLNPLLMLAVFTIAFGSIFKGGNWPTSGPHPTPTVLAIFCGMVVFGVFGEVLSRAPGLIAGNASYVKKVVFPLEILPVTVLGSALMHALIGLAILLLGQITLGSGLHWTVVCLPLVLLPLVLLSLGIGWFFAALGVFVKDLGQSIGVINQVLFFLSPIVYPATMPEGRVARALLRANPLTPIIESTRAVILFGTQPDWLWLGIATVCGAVFAQCGYAFFQRTREAFADVL